MPLSDRQAAFVREYSVDCNATQAAIRAGYSERTAKQQGARLLTNADVRAAVDEALAEAGERAGHTREELIARLWAIVLGDLRDVLEWGPGGARLRASSELTDEQAALVRELRLDQQQLQLGEDAEAWLVKSVVKTHDPLRAAQLLSRLMGWDVQKVEHSGSVGLTLEGLHRLAGEAEGETPERE